MRQISLLLFFLFGLNISSFSLSAPGADTVWTDLIRRQPYVFSLGMHENLKTIRSWILLSNGYCEQTNRHLLFDIRGRYLSWMENTDSQASTQMTLNQLRQSLVSRADDQTWIPGSEQVTGYPFALRCDQPHVDIADATDRIFGRQPDYQLWGTWDGMSAGTKAAPVSLYKVAFMVYSRRMSDLNQSVNPDSFRYFLAQIIIESGGVKQSLSDKQAVGILQLTPAVLNDCAIDREFWQHRMAQVDCAVRFYYLNQRNLRPEFEQRFGHLPAKKKQRLFDLLLIQSYHSGIGALNRLLTQGETAQASQYFAQQHQRFSAGDIATGLIYHNLGRDNWGLASLYYVVDISLIAEEICQQSEAKDYFNC